MSRSATVCDGCLQPIEIIAAAVIAVVFATVAAVITKPLEYLLRQFCDSCCAEPPHTPLGAGAPLGGGPPPLPLTNKVQPMNAPFLSHTFHVGPRTVTMTLNERPNKYGSANITCLQCEWFPNPPSRLSRHERRQYLKGRGKFMSTLAKKLNGGIAVLDL